MTRRFLLAPLLLALAACGPADTAPSASDAWVRPAAGTDAGRVTTAAYFTLRNPGREPITLTAVETDVAETIELHETTMEDGIMRMRPLPEGLTVPPRGAVELRPGGPHVMLIGLRRDLAEGDTVALTLRFADGEALALDAPVGLP